LSPLLFLSLFVSTSRYKDVQVQLLASPKSDGLSGAPRWSALVMDGVAVPYEEVVGIRMVESAHEFIVEHRTSSTRSLRHLRMHSSSEFELWRVALHPKVRLPKAAAQSSDASSSLSLSSDGPFGGLSMATQSCAHAPRGGRLTVDFARTWLERREAEAMAPDRSTVMDPERQREAAPPAYLPGANVEVEVEDAWEDEEEPFKFLVFV